MTIKNNNSKKSGFSLFEALVSMLIMSLFFIASSRIITQKHPVEMQRNPHGYYECYEYDGVRYQHRALGDSHTPTASNVSSCKFVPPSGANFVTVHYFSKSEYGTEYYNTLNIIMNMELSLSNPTKAKDFLSGLIEKPQVGNKAETEFITYLKLTHPSSNVYKLLTEGNADNIQVFMVSW